MSGVDRRNGGRKELVNQGRRVEEEGQSIDDRAVQELPDPRIDREGNQVDRRTRAEDPSGFVRRIARRPEDRRERDCRRNTEGRKDSTSRPQERRLTAQTPATVRRNSVWESVDRDKNRHTQDGFGTDQGTIEDPQHNRLLIQGV